MFINFKLFFVRYRMANFVYHHWVYTSTYWPLSYPFRSLGILCMCVFVESIYGLFRTTRMVFKSPRKIAPWKELHLEQKILEKIIFLFFSVPPQQFISKDGGIAEMGAEIQVSQYWYFVRRVLKGERNCL